jgi:hypothetical protein
VAKVAIAEHVKLAVAAAQLDAECASVLEVLKH